MDESEGETKRRTAKKLAQDMVLAQVEKAIDDATGKHVYEFVCLLFCV